MYKNVWNYEIGLSGHGVVMRCCTCVCVYSIVCVRVEIPLQYNMNVVDIWIV